MNKLIQEFEILKTDKEKWQWIIKNQDKGITVYCDNDDTFAILNDDDDGILQFDFYIGLSDGIFELLEAIGIKAERV